MKAFPGPWGHPDPPNDRFPTQKNPARLAFRYPDIGPLLTKKDTSKMHPEARPRKPVVARRSGWSRTSVGLGGQVASAKARTSVGDSAEKDDP